MVEITVKPEHLAELGKWNFRPSGLGFGVFGECLACSDSFGDGKEARDFLAQEFDPIRPCRLRFDGSTWNSVGRLYGRCIWGNSIIGLTASGLFTVATTPCAADGHMPSAPRRRRCYHQKETSKSAFRRGRRKMLCSPCLDDGHWLWQWKGHYTAVV